MPDLSLLDGCRARPGPRDRACDARPRDRAMVQSSSADRGRAGGRRDRPCPRSRRSDAVADHPVDARRAMTRPSTSTRTMSRRGSRPSAVLLVDPESRRSAPTGSVGLACRDHHLGQSRRSRRRPREEPGLEAPGGRGRVRHRGRRRISSPVVGHRVSPVFAFHVLVTDLWMIRQVRRCSARARGSPSRAARAELALELAMAREPFLAEASVGQRRSDRAARLAVVSTVAEPARRRRCRRRRRTRRRRPRRRRGPRARGSPACRRAARRPAARTARGGSSCGDRANREPRTSAVAWRSSPSSTLTSVDLPTPDEPRIAAVVPGRRWPRRWSRPWPVHATPRRSPHRAR